MASAGSTLFDTATVTGNVKNMGVTSTDTELTTVKPSVDLTITKTDSPDPVCARSWPGTVPVPLLGPPVCLGGLTYTFVVGNSGVQTATGVVVRDPLPAGTVFDHFVAPGFAGCAVDPATNVLTCTGGVVGPESTTTITIVLVAPPFIGTITNTVTVDPNNAIFESDETNNTATQTTQVSTGIDLTVIKTDSIDPVATSGPRPTPLRLTTSAPRTPRKSSRRNSPKPAFRTPNEPGQRQTQPPEYMGDAHVGAGANIGAGTIACNYDGVDKHHTEIGARAFIGSGVDGMHNEVRVDPNNEIAEVNEANNIAFQNTDVISGGGGQGAFNQLTIFKTQTNPPKPPVLTVARNALAASSP